MRAMRMGALLLLALLFVRLVYMIATARGGIDGFIWATGFAVAPFVAALVVVLSLFVRRPADVMSAGLWFAGLGLACFGLGLIGLEQRLATHVQLSDWQVAGVGAMIAGFWGFCGGLVLLVLSLFMRLFGAGPRTEYGS